MPPANMHVTAVEVIVLLGLQLIKCIQLTITYVSVSLCYESSVVREAQFNIAEVLWIADQRMNA